MARLEPRRPRIASSDTSSRLWDVPSPFVNNTWPAMCAWVGSRRVSASDVTDFPDPDSPTRPRTSPGAMVKERSRTATVPGVVTDGDEVAVFLEPAFEAAGKAMARFRT